MSTRSRRQINDINRAQRVLARARRRQLELAMQGRVSDSARYAARADRVRVHAAPVERPVLTQCSA